MTGPDHASSAENGTCHIHVGMDFTDPQSFLDAEWKKSLPASFHHLDSGGRHQGQVLRTAFAECPEKLPSLVRKGMSKDQALQHSAELRHQIDQEIHARPGKNTIISDRTLLDFQEQDLRNLRDYLLTRYSRLRIIAYVPTVRHHLHESFKEQLRDGDKSLDIGKSFPSFRKRLEKFETVFGRDQVVLKPFHAGTDTLEDFCQDLGITRPAVLPPEPECALSLEAAALLFAYRQYGGRYHRPSEQEQLANRSLVQGLSGIGDEAFAFSSGLIASLTKQNQSDLEWVEERLNAPLTESGSAHGDNGIRNAADLLGRSVAAAEKLLAANSGSFKTTCPHPRTAREAAQVVHDFMNYLCPPAGVGRSAFHPSATQEERRHLLQADRITMIEGPACYIHIGMAKTGTTSIQDSLRKARKSTEFAYLGIGQANHSRVMIASFSHTPERFPYFRKSAMPVEEVRQYATEMRGLLEDALQANAHRKLIISGESMITLKEAELEGLRQFVSRYYSRIYIVAYLRAPKSYMESIFQQRLKGGCHKKGFDSSYPSYIDKLKKFDNVFGAENVILRKFDPALYPNRDVVLDFCQLLGITIQGYQPIKTNESLSLEAVALLFSYWHHGGKFGKGEKAILRNRKLVSALRGIKGRKLSFSAALTEKIIHQHREDLEWLEKRAGFTLGNTSTADDTPDSVSTIDGLMSYSMEGARKLTEVFAGQFKSTIPNPRNPAHAARVLHDYVVTLDPTMDCSFPIKSERFGHIWLRRIKKLLRRIGGQGKK